VSDLTPGVVVLVDFDPVRGREQAGQRPALVVSSDRYLALVDTLLHVLPITSVERGWANHVPLRGASGLSRPSYVMTEQLRTVTRNRILRVVGAAAPGTLQEVRLWLRDFLDLG